MTMSPAGSPIGLESNSGCRLWIDGVGCWLLWWGDQLTIGNGRPAMGTLSKMGTLSQTGRLRIMADLQTQHATWQRLNRENWLQIHAATRINGREVSGKVLLRNGDEIQLGESVKVVIQTPSPLSPSSIMTITSGQRMCDFLDGVVLFSQTCLLGSEQQCHIQCRNWKHRIVFFNDDGHLAWRTNQPGAVPGRVHAGEIIETSECQLRIESGVN